MSSPESNPQTGKGVFAIERRKHERYDVEFPLDYSLIEGKEKYEGMVVNASEGGIMVYLPEKLTIGDIISIEIFIAKELELHTIKAIAKIVWYDWAARVKWGEHRYGLEFKSIYKGDFLKLKGLLKEIGERPDRQKREKGIPVQRPL